MDFNKLLNEQKDVINHIEKLFTTRKFPHALLFVEIPNINTLVFSSIIAASLLSNQQKIIKNDNEIANLIKSNLNSNLYILDASEKTIKKEEYLKIINDLSQTSITNNQTRVAIINNIENSSVYGLNSILKFLEDPPENKYFIIITRDITKVLPTIVSRVMSIRLKYPNFAELIKKDNLNDLLFFRLGVVNESQEIKNKVISFKEKIIQSFDQHFVKGIPIIKSFDYVLEESFLNLSKYFLPILFEFLNDIWRYEIKLDLSIKDANKTLKTLIEIKYDYQKAIRSCLEAIENLNYYVNSKNIMIKLFIALKQQ